MKCAVWHSQIFQSFTSKHMVCTGPSHNRDWSRARWSYHCYFPKLTCYIHSMVKELSLSNYFAHSWRDNSCIRVVQRKMMTKADFILFKTPEQEHHHRMQFSVIHKAPLFWVLEGFLTFLYFQCNWQDEWKPEIPLLTNCLMKEKKPMRIVQVDLCHQKFV